MCPGKAALTTKKKKYFSNKKNAIIPQYLNKYNKSLYHLLYSNKYTYSNFMGAQRAQIDKSRRYKLKFRP